MKKKSVAKNYIYNLIYQLLTIFLPLVTTPYVSRVLGAEGIGIYGYTVSIVTYFILFGTLGVSMYGQREIAYIEDNPKKISKTFWEIIILRTITLSISILLFYLIYGINGEYALYYRLLIIQLAANLFDISWLFQGLEEFDKTVFRNLIVKTLCLILIFTLVKTESDLWKYFLIYVGAEFIGNISLWLYLPKYLVKVDIKKLNFKKHFKPILALFIPQIAIQIYTVLDKTMIGTITHDMEEVGYFDQAQKVVRAAQIIVTSLQLVINSRIANAYAKNDKKEIKESLKKSFNYVWLIATPMMFGLMAIAYKFVPWYYGKGFDEVTPILIATSPILLIIGLSGVTGTQYLVQIDKTKEFTISVIAGALANVFLNFILIHYFKGVGAAISSVFAETVVLLVQLKYFKEQFKLRDILKLGIKCVIASIIMYFVLVYLTNILSVSIINTLTEIIIGMIIYAIVLLLLKYQFLKDLYNQIIIGIKSKLK